ncbi:MAG TPA: thiamine-binding protein [Thermodesulfobacteriota bacterium]|nr:thiamine-binding protein [Thermodesulfobacteriota bacterium]
MPIMEIAFPPLDKRIRDTGDFITFCVLLSKQKGVKCKLKSTKIIMEGDKDILLEILHEIDHALFSMKTNNIEVSLKIHESAPPINV